MLLLERVTQLCIAITVLFLVMFGAVWSMDLAAGLPAQTCGLALWYTLGCLLATAFAVYMAGARLISGNPVVGEGLILGARAIAYWFLAAIMFSIVLRLDFSLSGASFAFFFFLWPSQLFLLLFSPYACFLGAVILLGIFLGVGLLLDYKSRSSRHQSPRCPGE